MNTLIGYDLVPEPKILEAALRACRRLDDLATAIRILEAVKVREKGHLLNVIIFFAVGVLRCNRHLLLGGSHKLMINVF